MNAASFETVFRTMPSPVGVLTLAAERDAATGAESMIALLFERHAHGVDGSEAWRPDRRSDGVLVEARRQLDEYFAGERRRFDIPIDWTLVGEWGRKILDACAHIPFGEVRTYGDMAASAGSPKASRAAGTALGHNPVPVVVPCHRVLPAGGRSIGNYTGGVHIKEHLLRLEGVLAL
jgi:methylated-DNA-[protein]-cysteine S-methyltransferase